MQAEKKLNYKGHSIFYRVIGAGKSIVFIHGFGEDGDIWGAPSNSPERGEPIAQDPLFDDSFLLSTFKFIIPDLPGSGKSEMIEDMSMEGMAEVIKNIVDTEFPKVPPSGGFRGAFIGHSMGGYVALAFAEKYPGYLNGLGLFHSTAYPDSEERKANRKKAIEFINQHGSYEFLKTAIPNLFSPHTHQQTSNLIAELVAKANNFSPSALVSYCEAMMQRPERTAVLRNLKIPMLFVAGKYDTAIPLNDSLEQCHLPEISYFHILAESGHMGMLEEAEKSNRILNDYLINLS